jgi:exodeoxyribonuclease V alpha subunit
MLELHQHAIQREDALFMDLLRCVVERITFQNEQNGYTVLKGKAKGYHELVTIVGEMPSVVVGSVLSLQGFWKNDSTYGPQFTVQSFEETLPATVYGIEKYLGSGLIKGIGPIFAKKIVNTFGTDTLEIIETDVDRLLEIRGIGKVRVERVKKSWQEQKEIKNIMLFLQSHGVSTSHATKIFKTYGSDSIAIVKENPYKLADDIWGIGFKTADTIAEKLGMAKDADVRLRSGLLYALNTISEDGHCFALTEELFTTAVKLLETTSEKLQPIAAGMVRAEDVISEDEAIYLPPFYFSEIGVAKKIRTLITTPAKACIDSSHVIQRLKRSDRGGITYDEIQMQAIETALASKFMVLTGGPGTGKTTTTLGIIQAFKASGLQVLCAAPTGRAAKRMSEATGMEAKTIHRLLEFKPPQGYQRTAENPLEADVLILDECSMIDIILMYNLLKAVPDSMTVVMVGDTDQLPSVGAGNVLNDIIASETVPVVRLKRIFRQALGSRIIMNAHRINQGKGINIANGKDSDFFFIESATPEEALEQILNLVTTRLTGYYHADPIRDIQVLTPMQRGIVGAANLNRMLQERLNPTSEASGTPSLSRAGIEYRLHDKVMQIKNDYDKEVFNGDIGTIKDVNLEEQELTISFDDRDVVYDRSDLGEVVLAYATTIHKSQGSEYPIVVLPFMMTHFVMLQRNLLYTAVTRAKKILVLIGERKAISYAIRNQKPNERNTRLAVRLKDECSNKE